MCFVNSSASSAIQENKHSQCCAECHRAARKKISDLQAEIETINKCFGDGDREAFMKRYSDLQSHLEAQAGEINALGETLCRRTRQRDRAIQEKEAYRKKAIELHERWDCQGTEKACCEIIDLEVQLSMARKNEI